MAALCGKIQLVFSEFLNLLSDTMARGISTNPTRFTHFRVVHYYRADPTADDDIYQPSGSAVAQAIVNCTNLMSVVLVSCDFVDNDLLDAIPGKNFLRIFLFLYILGGSQLRHLNLSGCWNFDEKSLIKLLNVCPKISLVSLQGNLIFLFYFYIILLFLC